MAIDSRGAIFPRLANWDQPKAGSSHPPPRVASRDLVNHLLEQRSASWFQPLVRRREVCRRLYFWHDVRTGHPTAAGSSCRRPCLALTCVDRPARSWALDERAIDSLMAGSTGSRPAGPRRKVTPLPPVAVGPSALGRLALEGPATAPGRSASRMPLLRHRRAGPWRAAAGRPALP